MGLMNLKNTDDTLDFESLFRDQAEALVVLLKKSGIEIDALAGESLPFFSKLSPQKKETVIFALQALFEACEDMQASDASLTRNRSIAWRVMNTIGFKPQSDVFGMLEESDIIEIYDADFQIVFATPAFFQLTSYTLEDLYCRPWTELWYREPEIHSYIHSKVMETVLTERPQTVVVDVPVHKVQEICSHEGRRANARTKLFSAIEDNDRRRGFLCVSEFHGMLQAAYEAPRARHTPSLQ
jgi:PAS domain-containing protein